MTETYVQVLGSWGNLQGWATIDYCDSIGGYEWDEFHVLRGPDGRLYVGESGGCSCDSFQGNLDPSDMTPVSGWPEARKRIQAWITDNEWSGDSRRAVALDLIERLNANPPKARIKVDPTKPFVESH